MYVCVKAVEAVEPAIAPVALGLWCCRKMLDELCNINRARGTLRRFAVYRSATEPIPHPTPKPHQQQEADTATSTSRLRAHAPFWRCASGH